MQGLPTAQFSAGGVSTINRVWLLRDFVRIRKSVRMLYYITDGVPNIA